MSTLKVAGFLEHSTVNGEGFRSVLFLSGCLHHCPGCHNPEMQSFEYGNDVPINVILAKIKKNLPLIDGITLSGGDPFEQATSLILLLKEVKALGLSIWAYTGYTYEQLLQEPKFKPMLELTDVLVDGPFIKALKTDTKKYVGSSNQRIFKLLNGQIEKELFFS